MAFDKVQAFADLGKTIDNARCGAPDNDMAAQIRSLMAGTDFLKKIYDQGFKDGFDKCLDAKKIVDELDGKTP